MAAVAEVFTVAVAEASTVVEAADSMAVVSPVEAIGAAPAEVSTADRTRAEVSAACVEVRTARILPQCPTPGHGKDVQAPATLHPAGIRSQVQRALDQAAKEPCLPDQARE